MHSPIRLNKELHQSYGIQSSLPQPPTHQPINLTNHLHLSIYADPHLRTDIFQTSEQTIQPRNLRQNAKAIGWIMKLCWSKSYSQQTQRMAIMIYHAFKCRHQIVKSQIQLLLLICVQLASKFHESKHLQTKDFYGYLNQPLVRQNILELEQRILTLLNFNLVIPNYIQKFVIFNRDQQSQTHDKMLFLCDLYTFKSHDIFFNFTKLQKLFLIIKGLNYEQIHVQLYQIRQPLQISQAKFLYKKYCSKFEVELFIQQLS